MPIPHTYRAEAIVLKGMDLGEADRIITLYTRSFGKVRAVAKGARRPTGRLAGHVEPLAHSVFQLAKGRALKTLRFLARNDLAEATRVRIDAPLAIELERHLRGFLQVVLDRDVTSARLLDDVRALQSARA